MNTKRATKNLLYSVFSQMITICLGLAIPRLVMIGYGSETNGLLSSVTQLIIYLNLFEAGVQMVAVQSLYAPVSIDDQSSINRILAAVNISYRKTGAAYLGMLLILAVVYPWVLVNSELNYWTVFCVVLFSGLGNVVLFFFQGKYRILLQAEGKNYVLTNLQTMITVLNHLAKILCLTLGYDIVTVVFISFVISMIQSVYICRMIKCRYSWIDLNCSPDNRAIAQKNSALLHQIAGMVFQNTDVLIITFFCGLKVVSVYSVYKLITSHLSGILNSVYNSFSFALGQRFHTDRVSFTEMIDTVDVYFSGIIFSLYTVAAVLFLPFIELYTQGVTDIAYADPKLCMLFVAVELLTFARLPMLNTINYAGHFKNTLPQSMIETAINLTVSLTAVQFLGIYGVLLGTVAALVYRNVDIFRYTNRKILNRSAGKTFCIYFVDAAVFALIWMGLQGVSFRIESYWQFICVGVILTPVVVGIYLTALSVLFVPERKRIQKTMKGVLCKYCR